MAGTKEKKHAKGGGASLKVNEDYARRFEYNKKRAELHRLEEKYGKGDAPANADDGDSEDSEEGVEEDDAAELLDEALDEEVNATLQALRAKDPRIYNKEVKFYREPEEGENGTDEKKKKEPSMTLRDYHTKNLLEGKYTTEDVDEEDAPPRTYAQEQEEARQELVKALDAADGDDDDDFIVAKEKPEKTKNDRPKITVEDVEKADQDPETFLSNFMASRAWVPTKSARFQPLDEDESDEDAAADEWENSYNLYFEDTTGANEKIMTYARDAVASTTVRRDDKSGRRKAREAARAKREAERREKEQDLARLRKLKVEEMENKVKQIRQIGGLNGRDFKIDEWKDVLEADWSDEQWDAEMQKRFGDAYYGEGDAGMEEEQGGKKGKKPKKPKFDDDDIDIKDLVPDFKEDDDDEDLAALSSGDEEMPDAAAGDSDDESTSATKKSSKKRKQERAEAKSAARRDRRLIENLVNQNLEYEAALAAKPNKKHTSRFRYRETSPTSFGLTARDILLADDKALNEFAGLKKLAAFRDPVKKKKDKKFLSKKARIRQWRKDTFGDPDGPKGGFEMLLATR
ncbi:Ribosome biogenesis protein Kri1 [Pyrenophora tritici-repentis]|uniref:Ribosome biogenesis protein Kri1 n=1 Tax=Pyrenophora tritici-repentis TaxID=45151 RepID=A0A5M9L8F4_9PLEO|nr:Ribosome biogenesis protein Kri1 [Pyrenophora tritici-repentis]KAF7448576.1 Ribosome biogenesis protein Kri1 [Pyrenophora tritici-repentis]KAF7572296.1 ribosome biogenesis protein Kri1 [Pyrenophora tritici-repentis]KAI0623314.1 Ribosome biogenesis protein Kri1 [Pyrenophora tritici-repentis]